MTSSDDALTESQIQFFADNGFVGPFRLYSPEEAVERWNRAKIEMVLSRNKPHGSSVLNYDRHLDCNTLSEHVTRPEIVAKLRGLIGPDVLCWKTNIFPKYPGDAGTGWHQVETFAAAQHWETPVPALKYTEKTGHMVAELTVWTAFSPAYRRHGCLTFLPGTHKKWYYDESRPMATGVEVKRNDFFGYDYSELKIDADWDPDAQECVALEMEAGQFVIFSSKCVHGSLPNTTTDETRLGFASRYVSPSVRVYDGISRLREFGEEIDLAYHGCVLVAGEDRYGHNKLHAQSLNGYPFPKVY